MNKINSKLNKWFLRRHVRKRKKETNLTVKLKTDITITETELF